MNGEVYMNRYVITKETFKGQEYRISALYDSNKKMIEVLPEPFESENTSILGNIYIGRVENVVKNLNAAFVKISPEQNCYLPLEDLKNPIFTKKLSEKKMLVAGEELLVQVSREALKTKEPAVTTNLNLTGKYAVLTSGNHRLSVSSKLSKDVRRHYQEMLMQGTSVLNHEQNSVEIIRKQEKIAGEVAWTGTNDTETCKNDKKYQYGIIVRTNAAEVADEVVLSEIEGLRQRYEKLVETACHKTCYSLLYQEEPTYLKHLSDLRQDCLEEIVTDDREIFEEICVKYHIFSDRLMTGGSVSVPVNEILADDGIKLRYHNDTSISLSALYSVSSSIEDALKERIWLKSGAYLIIQPTEALTVIDVNTGKNVAKKDVQENFLKINKEAAVEIARQLRLRNISGIVVIDFMNLSSADAEAELMSTFRAELKKDPVPTQLIDITKLGLVEVTRKKVRKSLREMLHK